MFVVKILVFRAVRAGLAKGFKKLTPQKLKKKKQSKTKKAGKVLQGPTEDELIGGVICDLSAKKKSVLKSNKKEKHV